MMYDAYPRDAFFRAWLAQGPVWLPERGMGYYPVQGEAPYDAAYWQKYVEYAGTDMGRRLTDLRVEMLERYAPEGAVCDVGIGCGAFVEALRTRGRDAYGYDINPVAVAWLDERGWMVNPSLTAVRALTFWDSLEHLPEPGAVLRRVPPGGVVLASLPIFRDTRHLMASRHFRRDEHRWYWTRDGLIGWMAAQGFECLEHGTPESLAGREDIHTFAFVKQAEARRQAA